VLGFILRDGLMEGLRLHASQKNILLPASWHGKLKTIFQMIGILFLASFFPFEKITTNEIFSYLIIFPIFIALILSFLSFLLY
jgi:phosphatidylglycerophosphate synthase